MMRIWAKREAQLRLFLTGVRASMETFKGIAGQTMPNIQKLDLQLIENAPASK